MQFDFQYALSILPILLQATVVTIAATIGGMVVALVVGLLVAILRITNLPVLGLVLAIVVDFVRTTPLLIQLYVVYYVLPLYGLVLPAFETGVVVLGLNYSAYTSEVYRAGLLSVHRGQWEAATALNLSASRTLIDIIVPQAVRPMVPALGNYLIGMFKETPLLATITVPELLATAEKLSFSSFKYLETFTMVGLIFLMLSYPSSRLIHRLEAKQSVPNVD